MWNYWKLRWLIRSSIYWYQNYSNGIDRDYGQFVSKSVMKWNGWLCQVDWFKIRKEHVMDGSIQWLEWISHNLIFHIVINWTSCRMSHEFEIKLWMKLIGYLLSQSFTNKKVGSLFLKVQPKYVSIFCIVMLSLQANKYIHPFKLHKSRQNNRINQWTNNPTINRFTLYKT